MPRPAPYPTLFRVTLLGAVALGALVSFSAAQGVGLSAMAGAVPPDGGEVKLGWLAGVTPYAKQQEAAMKASRKATFGAIESMGAARVVILLGLSATASMVFLGALFIRWSLRAPRTAIARLVGGAAFGAALFRTLDGAQELVIHRRAAEAKVPDVGLDSGLGLVSAVSVGWTAFVVALFVLLGTYFRSDGVRGLLEAAGDGGDDEPGDD